MIRLVDLHDLAKLLVPVLVVPASVIDCEPEWSHHEWQSHAVVEVLEALQARLDAREGRYMPPQRATIGPRGIIECTGVRINLDSYEVQVHGELKHVPPTELRLLEIFVRNPNVTMSRAELSEHVWPGRERSDNALQVYIGYLRRRFQDLKIATKHGFGYVLIDDPVDVG